MRISDWSSYVFSSDLALRSMRPWRLLSTSSLVPLAATGSLALVTAAQAQGAPAQGAPAQAAAQPTASDIVVTGTRISGFTAPTPVTAISQAQLQEQEVRTEERRVGQECVSTCRTGLPP